jgi:uncharacterized RDD family membrane protein YckC
MNDSTIARPRYAGLFRRLFAISYDCFLLIAILLTTSAIATAINGGKAVEPGNAIYPLLVLLIFLLCYLYFSWFWINGGQSLGMKTWRIQLRRSDQESRGDLRIDHKTAAIRFFTAIISWTLFGLGFLWALFDKKNRCWHDISSKTVLIDLRPGQKQAVSKTTGA